MTVNESQRSSGLEKNIMPTQKLCVGSRLNADRNILNFSIAFIVKQGVTIPVVRLLKGPVVY